MVMPIKRLKLRKKEIEFLQKNEDFLINFDTIDSEMVQKCLESVTKKRQNDLKYHDTKAKNKHVSMTDSITDSTEQIRLDKIREDNIYAVNTKSSAYTLSFRRILTHLNKVTGKNFKEIASNSKFIIGRLKEGYTEEDLIRVIDNKSKDEFFKANNGKYLRPETLFNQTKFQTYVNECASKKKELEYDYLLSDYKDADGNWLDK
jgi:uncharacterized phage protein (TIGR02220 family)